MANKQRVVVTGLGVASPIGLGIESFWDALIQKQCGIQEIEAFDASKFGSCVGGELPAFSLRDYVPKTYRKNAKVMARDILIAVMCAYHTVKDAGLKTRCLIDRGEVEGPPNVDSRRFGVNIGAGLISADLPEIAGAWATAADDQRQFSLGKWGQEGMNNLTPLWLLKFLPNMLACHVTIVHDAQAPSNTLTCGEAAGHLAIGEAFRTIARGDADVCISGGAECKIKAMSIARHQLAGWLNTKSNDRPGSASLPFGANRSGMVVAEGGGLVVLESLEHAQGRGARIYAEVVGFGASASAHSWSAPDPTGRNIAVALRKALGDADTGIDDIDLVAPLGVGTVNHDAAEMAGWNDVFGTRLDDIHALCTRGATGNCGAGAGAIDLAAMIFALHRNTVPPSVNTSDLDSASRFRFVNDGPVDACIRQAVSVGCALGGQQTGALVFRRFEE